MESNIFPARLAEARIRNHLSLRALSQKAGISVSAMSQYEKGDTMPPLRLAIRIAEALGVTLDWLVGMDNDSLDYLPPFTTYGRVARALWDATGTPGINFDIDTNGGYVEGDRFHGDVTITIHDDATLFDFFSKGEKAIEALTNIEGGSAILTEWANAAISKLDEQEIIPTVTPYTPPEEV